MDEGTKLITRYGVTVTQYDLEKEANGWFTTSDWDAWFIKNQKDLTSPTLVNEYIKAGILPPDYYDQLAQAVDVIKNLAWQAGSTYATAGIMVGGSRFLPRRASIGTAPGATAVCRMAISPGSCDDDLIVSRRHLDI